MFVQEVIANYRRKVFTGGKGVNLSVLTEDVYWVSRMTWY